MERQFRPNLSGWIDLYLRLAEGSDERSSSTEVVRRGGWGTSNISVGVDFGPKREYRLIADLFNLGNKSYTPSQENLLAAQTSIFVKLVANF